MLTVAGGIILAVLSFVFLPLIIVIASRLMVVASALFVVVLIVGGVALAVLLVGPWGTVGIVAILAGFALIAWYRIMTVSDHQIDDGFRRRYPYLGAKLDKQNRQKV